MMNCTLWIFYSLPYVHPDSTFIITIYSFGLFLEIIYLSIFFIYSSKNKHRVGKKKKRRSLESRARCRENRHLRRLKEMEGCTVSETEGSEFETDDGGETQRSRSLSPTFRGSRTSGLEDHMGLDVHSNRFDILEDEDHVDDESAMAMVLHDGTADALIIHEAKKAKGVRNGAASNGSSPMEIASNGDRRPAIETPVKKARVSTSWPT